MIFSNFHAYSAQNGWLLLLYLAKIMHVSMVPIVLISRQMTDLARCRVRRKLGLVFSYNTIS